MYSFYIHLRKQAKGADSIFAPIFILVDASSYRNVHKYLKFLYRKICCLLSYYHPNIIPLK